MVVVVVVVVVVVDRDASPLQCVSGGLANPQALTLTLTLTLILTLTLTLTLTSVSPAASSAPETLRTARFGERCAAVCLLTLTF